MTYTQVVFALMIWREGRGASHTARLGIGYCVKKRADHPGWWGKNILEVVTHKFQFSSMGDPHDPQLLNWPEEGDTAMADCLDIAGKIMNGTAEPNPFPGCDSYFDTSIQPPNWATPDKHVGNDGRLRFYNIAGGA